MSESPSRGSESIEKNRLYWEKHARRYDATMGPLGRAMPGMVARVGQSVSGAKRVLEVAAGTGLVTPVIAANASEVVSTDYAAAMVEQLKSRVSRLQLDNVRCQQADIYHLPFESGTFDTVVAANVLHLVPDLPEALAALHRMLKPGGKLIAPTFCHDETHVSWIVSRLLALTGFPGHRRFSARTLERAISSAGFEVKRVETLPGLLPIGYVEARRA